MYQQPRQPHGPRAFLARVQPRERPRVARCPLPGPYFPPELPRGGQPLLRVPPSLDPVLDPVPGWPWGGRTLLLPVVALPEAPPVCSLATRARQSRLDPLNLPLNLRHGRILGSNHREHGARRWTRWSSGPCWTGEVSRVTPLGSSSTQTLLGSVSTCITNAVNIHIHTRAVSSPRVCVDGR